MNEWMNEWMNECSQTCGTEMFVFQSAIQAHNNQDTRTWIIFTCVRLGLTYWQRKIGWQCLWTGGEVDSWTEQRVVNRAMGKTGQRGVFWSVLLTKYYLADKIKIMRRTERVACVGDRRVACRILVGNFLSTWGPTSFSRRTRICGVS
jgi:hypothetical protein